MVRLMCCCCVVVCVSLVECKCTLCMHTHASNTPHLQQRRLDRLELLAVRRAHLSQLPPRGARERVALGRVALEEPHVLVVLGPQRRAQALGERLLAGDHGLARFALALHRGPELLRHFELQQRRPARGDRGAGRGAALGLLERLLAQLLARALLGRAVLRLGRVGGGADRGHRGRRAVLQAQQAPLALGDLLCGLGVRRADCCCRGRSRNTTTCCCRCRRPRRRPRATAAVCRAGAIAGRSVGAATACRRCGARRRNLLLHALAACQDAGLPVERGVGGVEGVFCVCRVQNASGDRCCCSDAARPRASCSTHRSPVCIRSSMLLLL